MAATIDHLKNCADELYREGNFSGAIRVYASALEHENGGKPGDGGEPGNRNQAILCNLAAAYNQLGQHPKALEYANRCISYNPVWLKAYIRLAEVHRSMGCDAKAMAVLENVLERDPENTVACRMVDEMLAVKDDEAVGGRNSSSPLWTSRRPLSSLPPNEQVARARFFLQVMAILLSMAVVTALIVATISLSQSWRNSLIHNSQGVFWFTSVASFILLHGADRYHKSWPWNYVALAGFAIVEGLLLSVPCAVLTEFGMGMLVFEAFALTIFLFGGLATIPLVIERYDFTGWNRYCLMALQALLFFQVAGMFLGFTLDLAMLCGGVFLFCAFVVVDVQMVLERWGPDDAVKGAIHLYLDIVNLFMFILRILAETKGKERINRNNSKKKRVE